MMRVSKFAFTLSRMPSGNFRGIVYDPLKEPVKVFIGSIRKDVKGQCVSYRNQLKSRVAIRNDN